METNWKWYINGDTGLPYGTEGGGEVGEVQIPRPPVPYTDYNFVDGAWVAKTPEEKEAEEDIHIDREFDDSKAFRTLVKWISQKQSIPMNQLRQELRAIYKTLG